MALPLSLKTPPSGAAAVGNHSNLAATPTPSKPAAGDKEGSVGGTVTVSANIAAIVNLPDHAKPEVLSRSGNDAILRVGGSVMSVSGLKQDLTTVQRHIAFERERRLEAERLFASESESLLDKEQQDAVARREEELARLHDERTHMVEFLKRGTDEAKRISADCTVLKARANEKEITESDLQQERDTLEQVLERLSSDLEDHAHQLSMLEQSKDQMDHKQVELRALAVSTEKQTDDTAAKLAAVKGDLEKELVAARRVEAFEQSMAAMSAASRRLLHELEHINTNVVKISDERLNTVGDKSGGGSSSAAETDKQLEQELEAATVAPDYDSEVEAEDTRITAVVGATTRTRLARCSSIVKAMLTALLRYDLEIAARLVKGKKTHEETMAGVHKYLRETREECDGEMDTWNQKLRQREDQLHKANVFRNRAVTDTLKQHEDAMAEGDTADQKGKAPSGVLEAEKALLESAFSLTQYFERINAETQRERNAAVVDHGKLKDKTERYTKDYAMVKELRNQYRELETQKISLESTVRAAEEENRGLKMAMGGGPGGAGGPSGPGADGASSSRKSIKSRAAWRSNTFAA